MKATDRWDAIPLAIRYTGGALVALGLVYGLMVPRATAEQEHEALRQESEKQKVSIVEMLKNTRIDSLNTEKYRIEELILDKEKNGTLTEVDHERFIRRINEINANIECIRDEKC